MQKFHLANIRSFDCNSKDDNSDKSMEICAKSSINKKDDRSGKPEGKQIRAKNLIKRKDIRVLFAQGEEINNKESSQKETAKAIVIDLTD